MVDNFIEAIVPRNIARGMQVLRKLTFMPWLVNSDYSADAANRGAIIEVPLPPEIAVDDVIPANIPPVGVPFRVDVAPIPLDFWKKARFTLPADELAKIVDGETSRFLDSAATRLAETVNLDIINKMYKRSYTFVGDTVSVPFEDGSTIRAQESRRLLDESLAPQEYRHMVLNLIADQYASGLDIFRSYEKSGQNETLRTGLIGTQINFDWWRTQQMPTHISAIGLSDSYQINSTTHAIDDTSVAIEPSPTNNPVDFVEGDLFFVAGDTQSYVVTKATPVGLGSGDLILEYLPKARTAFANDALISTIPSHSISLAFQQDSTGFAARRRIEDRISQGLGGKVIETMTDLDTGLPLTYIIDNEYHQSSHEFSILCGTGVIRPEHIVRIIGAVT